MAFLQITGMAFLHITEIISMVSLGLTVILILLLRFVWRRGKPIQEP